ncbi:myozenin-3-like [Conger conger]|uniref:myozenin-3-like n=1 Tax=Conger conger TaxID=82655 RepID=UPI002A59CB9E|nr:myozenin-3-like [Conger conger]
MIQLSYQDLAKQRQQQVVLVNGDGEGVRLDLGRKISVPKDVMMEELQLKTNRGSRMFHERLKRVDRFTVENAAHTTKSGSQAGEAGASGAAGGAGEAGEAGEHAQGSAEVDGLQEGMENGPAGSHVSGPAGKTSLLASLQQNMSKKTSPDKLAPGYSGPLKGVPRERFNFTIIPKSYHCPWTRDMSNIMLATVTVQPPVVPPKPKHYKSFNRAPTPFGGGRITPAFEDFEDFEEPNPAWTRMCHRPDFNRAPRGWGESPELSGTPRSS